MKLSLFHYLNRFNVPFNFNFNDLLHKNKLFNFFYSIDFFNKLIFISNFKSFLFSTMYSYLIKLKEDLWSIEFCNSTRPMNGCGFNIIGWSASFISKYVWFLSGYIISKTKFSIIGGGEWSAPSPLGTLPRSQ
jgi:hypothetical protein